jgi:hypothetical protein
MAGGAPQEPRAQGSEDPTRDIRLPPVPGSPHVAVRPEPSSYAARPVPSSPSTASAPPARADVPADEPTDELRPAPGVLREKTLEFGHGQGPHGRPVAVAATQGRSARARRWPWVLVALLPLVVIVGSGIWLFVLLSRA